MLDDIRKPKSERREWIVEVLKDMNGMHTGFLHKGELIRCGECEYYDEEFHNCAIRDCYGWDFTPDDFCSYGKWKGADDETD